MIYGVWRLPFRSVKDRPSILFTVSGFHHSLNSSTERLRLAKFSQTRQLADNEAFNIKLRLKEVEKEILKKFYHANNDASVQCIFLFDIFFILLMLFVSIIVKMTSN